MYPNLSGGHVTPVIDILDLKSVPDSQVQCVYGIASLNQMTRGWMLMLGCNDCRKILFLTFQNA